MKPRRQTIALPHRLSRLWGPALLSCCCIWLAVSAPAGCRKPKGRNTPSVKGPAEHFTVVTLVPPGRRPVKVRAELAITEPQIRNGLMYRGELDPNGGMLFVFPADQVQTFWMKNTFIPLDMIFIDSRKVVVGVVHQAKPLTTTLRGIGEIPCRYVLEVNGGFAGQHGIAAGTRAAFKLPDLTDR